MKNPVLVTIAAICGVAVIGIVIYFALAFENAPPKIDADEEMTSKLESGYLSKYITKVSYEVGKKPITEGGYQYGVDVSVKVNNDFEKLNLYERYELLKSSIEDLEGKTTFPSCETKNNCVYRLFTIESPKSNYVADFPADYNEVNSFIVDGKQYDGADLYDKYFAKEDDEDNAILMNDDDDSNGNYYTKEELESDPVAPSTDPADYNSNGEYVPKNGPSSNPADYNANGEYDPIDGKSNEEIEQELEDMLTNNGVGK